jgi:hypothetical protein
MSTIVTRKSLALGAIVALATTAFAGTPAHAAGEINLAPSAGTSYATLSTEAFALESSFAPGVTNANSQLWFQVKTSTNVSVDVSTDTVDDKSFAAGDRLAASTGDASDATAYVRYIKAAGTGSTNRNFIALALHGATSIDSADVVVTAFVDSSNDNKLTAGEWSVSKTVSFKTYASVGAVATLDQPNTGDTTATGHVTLPGVNLTQVQHAVALVFQKHSTDALDVTSGTAGALAKAGLTADSTDAGDYKATTGTLRAFTSADVIDLIAKFNGVVVGSTVSKTATARTISKIEATVDTNDNGLATGNYGRLNSEVSVTGVVFDAVKTTDVIKDTAVTASVTSSRTVWSTDAAEAQSVTLNGVKYTTYATLTAAAVALTSDASGKVNVKLVPVNFVAGDTFVLSFKAQNLTKTVTVTEQAAALTVADADSAAVRAIAKNGTATLNYTVKDQFGVSASATNLRLKVTSALAAQFVAVSAGKATVSVTPTKDSTDSLDVAVALQSSSVDANQQTLWAATTGATNASNIRVNVAAVVDSFDTAPAVLKINNTTDSLDTAKQALENKAYSATDFPVVAGATLAQIRGSVVTDGSSVTVSGAGLAFVVKGKVYTDTVTFIAASGDAGDFDVYVAGHKSGKATVTFVTGAVTKTVDVTFAAAVVASLKNTVVAAPSAAQAGRAVTVTATLTDAYGNAIAGKTVQFALTGVGSLSSSDAVTDANGVASVRLVSSYGEDGDATVTVSHNGFDGVTDTSATTTANDFTLVKTVTFGITDAQVDIVGKRITAVASYTKGKTVAIYVDGVKVWSKVSASDSDVVVSRNLKKGTHTVTVKVSGGFVTTEKFIVK